MDEKVLAQFGVIVEQKNLTLRVDLNKDIDGKLGKFMTEVDEKIKSHGDEIRREIAETVAKLKAEFGSNGSAAASFARMESGEHYPKQRPGVASQRSASADPQSGRGGNDRYVGRSNTVHISGFPFKMLGATMKAEIDPLVKARIRVGTRYEIKTARSSDQCTIEFDTSRDAELFVNKSIAEALTFPDDDGQSINLKVRYDRPWDVRRVGFAISQLWERVMKTLTELDGSKRYVLSTTLSAGLLELQVGRRMVPIYAVKVTTKDKPCSINIEEGCQVCGISQETLAKISSEVTDMQREWLDSRLQ